MSRDNSGRAADNIFKTGRENKIGANRYEEAKSPTRKSKLTFKNRIDDRWDNSSHESNYANQIKDLSIGEKDLNNDLKDVSRNDKC